MSLIDASVSTEKEVSQLPLREAGPPSEASVAADRVEAVLEAWGGRRHMVCGNRIGSVCLSVLSVSVCLSLCVNAYFIQEISSLFHLHIKSENVLLIS